MVINPELADALSAIIERVSDHTGTVPLVVAYNEHERLWKPVRTKNLRDFKTRVSALAFGVSA
jgi:uncharacterized membrane protein